MKKTNIIVVALLALLVIFSMPLATARKVQTEVKDSAVCFFELNPNCELSLTLFQHKGIVFNGQLYQFLYFGLDAEHKPVGIIYYEQNGASFPVFLDTLEIGDLILSDDTDTGIDITQLSSSMYRLNIQMVKVADKNVLQNKET